MEEKKQQSGEVVPETERNSAEGQPVTIEQDMEKSDNCPDHGCACGRHKNTPREDNFQADLQKRLNRAIGQLNGVKNMIDDNRYCGDVLTQLAAAESAIHRVSEMVLHNHMQTCVVEQIRQGNDEIVEEAMDLIHKFGGK